MGGAAPPISAEEVCDHEVKVQRTSARTYVRTYARTAAPRSQKQITQ